jgi:hypothetical protein
MPSRPTFSVSDSFENLRECLHSRRSFVVRGAVSQSTLEHLAVKASAAYDDWDQKIAGRSDSEKALFHHGHIPIGELGDLGHLTDHGYISRLIRDGFRSSVSIIQLRRILAPSVENAIVSRSISFHQDEYFGMQHVPPGTPLPLSFTIWVPLIACGRDAPGLSVVLGSDKPIINAKPRFGWMPYILWKYGPAALWSPELALGDILVFTSRTIHGSYVRPTMTKTRYSLEIRGDVCEHFLSDTKHADHAVSG